MGLSDIGKQQYKYLKLELDLIKYIINQDIPYVGICLGAQLLAYASGGTVIPLIEYESNKVKAEIGWSKIKFFN